jgi:hypothetical protein
VRTWLPLFFRQAKFSSFTRKLYRWGFRQVNMTGEPLLASNKEICFANEYFRRDDRALLGRMRSVTAASKRKEAEEMETARRLNEEFQHAGPGVWPLLPRILQADDPATRGDQGALGIAGLASQAGSIDLANLLTARYAELRQQQLNQQILSLVQSQQPQSTTTSSETLFHAPSRPPVAPAAPDSLPVSAQLGPFQQLHLEQGRIFPEQKLQQQRKRHLSEEQNRALILQQLQLQEQQVQLQGQLRQTRGSADQSIAIQNILERVLRNDESSEGPGLAPKEKR